MSSVCIMPPHNAVVWYLNEMEKTYDGFAYYLSDAGRTFFRIRPDGPMVVYGDNNLFLSEPIALNPVFQSHIDDALCALNSTYDYSLNIYLTNPNNIPVDPKNDKIMITLENEMLKHIFGTENIVFYNDEENRENVGLGWNCDDWEDMTEYEPMELQALDPEQVANNVTSLMNDLQIALEPNDINEILNEPMLCQILLDPMEVMEVTEDWRNGDCLPTPLSDYLSDIDFSESEYDDYVQCCPL